ncbi:MAG: hypothetical protein AAF607_05405 [Pseudomonadota bacterium]
MKSLIRVIFALATSGVLAACATSPLYEEDSSSGYGTVPRDGMGEPIWTKIEPREPSE